jgi:hypothetical protein
MKVTSVENLLFYYIGYFIFFFLLCVLLEKINVHNSIPIIIFAQIYDIYYVMRFKEAYSNVLYILMHVIVFMYIPTYFLGIYLCFRTIIIFQIVNETFIKELHAQYCHNN